MSIEKSMFREMVFNEAGVEIEDVLEASKREEAAYLGAKRALLETAVKIDELTKHIDKDIEEEKWPHDLQIAQLVKDWITRASGVARNLATNAEVQQLTMRGKVMGLQQAMDKVKKKVDVEQAKQKALAGPQDAPVEGRPGQRVPGKHPGNPMAARRKLKSVPAPPEKKEPSGGRDAG